MLDLLLITTLGFLGSFGHCASMCGPLTVAFSLSQIDRHAESEPHAKSGSRGRQIAFHLLLNLGRILSYALVGAAIGAIGSLLFAGGQLAGIGSVVRRGVAILTGLSLIWFGLVQINPKLLPRIPLLNPMAHGKLHDRLSRAMTHMAARSYWWTPLLLGFAWGLIPCGFLYAAQIKAAETGNVLWGAITMLAFGVGTLPMMLGVGVSAALVSHDRRSQLFRMGGWVTLAIGILTLLRTGSLMVDVTGHAALICLMLALVARPISRIWATPLRYRRALGVGAFVLALAHTAHMLEHTWGWNLQAFAFMLPRHQLGITMGTIGLGLMAPAAFTSFDWAQAGLGTLWRKLHLLSVPALLLCAAHCFLNGSHYGGRLQITWVNYTCSFLLGVSVLAVLLVRSRWVWSSLSLDKRYVPSVFKAKPSDNLSNDVEAERHLRDRMGDRK